MSASRGKADITRANRNVLVLTRSRRRQCAPLDVPEPDGLDSSPSSINQKKRPRKSFSGAEGYLAQLLDAYICRSAIKG